MATGGSPRQTTDSNATLKLKFRKLHRTVVNNVNAASIMDFLFQEAVIGHDDMRRLRKFRDDPQEQCSELLMILHGSENQQAFIQLYAAIKDESHLQWLVERIDNQSVIDLLQQLYISEPTVMEENTEDALLTTQEYTQTRPDIVEMILAVVRQQWNKHGVLMDATACLYNLVRNDLCKVMCVRLLADMVELLLQAIEMASNQQQLVKNCLLILCNDHILQEVNFDHYRCSRLMLDCLCEYEDPTMMRMSIAICGILAAKIPTSQTSCLGSDRRYMQKLLSIIDSRINAQVIDTTLKFTLSTLQNLSDEAPLTCETFIAEGGMQMFLRVLETFTSAQPVERASLQVQLLGFLNNVAEVKDLKKILAEEEILSKVRDLLHSNQLDVSYFAGGIVAHLLADESTSHLLSSIVARKLCDELEEVVVRWQQPEQEMVTYRSFGPFFPLLSETADSAVQLYALWAWQHVCNLKGDRYCSLLVSEGGVQIISRILSCQTTHPQAIEIASDVLRMILAKCPSTVVGNA